ncbi:PIG-L family deacetylase [Candidatus Amesbacteria bacterium]|nr:PIG-L family deacetylase [Candidatus Amesbacteria bacterium]
MAHIIVISPHPDDMEIGMGGTVAKLADDGETITSVILTDGRRSPNPFLWTEEQMIEVRKREAIKASEVLGINEVIFFGQPDLKSENNYTIAKEKLRELIIKLKPVQVYTPHNHLDRHLTHQLTGQLVLESIKEAKFPSVNEVWAYEVWGLFPSWDRVEYIDDQVGKKLLAIAEHKSQIASIPYGEGAIGLNRWRAIFADQQDIQPKGAFAEVFISLKNSL